ncbi:MAG: NADH-quinone oxidoreductase subunit D [Pirellulaceae bacterium]|nr:NADH-quinone oxidoreductase subunit D [Pirellulaceae bacterium]
MLDPTLINNKNIEYDAQTNEMLINMGPQHPSTHGVLRLIIRTDGEIVSEIQPHIGYLHRCAEKIGEHLSARQWIPYTDRMDYLAAMNMNLGWSLTVEKLLDHQVSKKLQHLRLMICELGRIASHLVGMGAYGLDLGTASPFFYAIREREKILDLFEKACGARLTFSYITPGGVMADIPEGWIDECKAFLDYFEPIIKQYHTLLTTNAIFLKRTCNLGILSKEKAIDYGCSGAVLRGSGIDYDLRRDGDPFYTEMYDGYDFEVIVEKEGDYPKDYPYPDVPREAQLGDCWHRFYVRMLEVIQSIKLIRQSFEKYQSIPEPIEKPLKLQQKLPKGEIYLETEAPRGQMGFGLFSEGDPIPWKVRARSSCFCNLSVLPELCRGVYLADIPSIVGSLDIMMGEIDR